MLRETLEHGCSRSRAVSFRSSTVVTELRPRCKVPVECLTVIRCEKHCKCEDSVEQATGAVPFSLGDSCGQGGLMPDNENSPTATGAGQDSWTCLQLFKAQLSYEASKLCRLQLDYRLRFSDWRVVCAGGAFGSIGPVRMMLIRALLFAGQFTGLILDKFWVFMAYFTLWTNISVAIFLFLALLLSVVAVISLGRDKLEGPLANDPKYQSGVLAFFRRAGVRYEELLHEQKFGKHGAGDPGCGTGKTDALETRRCCVFWRPFLGERQRPWLESLIAINDGFVAISLPTALITCVVYWCLLHHTWKNRSAWTYALNVFEHSYCAVASWFLVVISRFPYRLCLLPLILVFGTAYVIMQVIVYVVPLKNAKGSYGYLYWFVDYGRNPELASVFSVCMPLVVAPLCYFVSWLLLWKKNLSVDPAPCLCQNSSVSKQEFSGTEVENVPGSDP